MSRTKNIIPEFTKPEIDYTIENVNFTEQELQFFNLRNKEYSYECCAEEMNVDTTTAKKIAKKTMNKITGVIRRVDI